MSSSTQWLLALYHSRGTLVSGQGYANDVVGGHVKGPLNRGELLEYIQCFNAKFPVILRFKVAALNVFRSDFTKYRETG